MEEHEDFYLILGLAPGLQGGTAASADAIRKAYRTRALLCHPDKRPDDPLAAAEFQRLQKAYDVLSDEKARKAYDDLLDVKKAKLERESRLSSKRRKMMEYLKERERAFGFQLKARADEERVTKRFQEEIARIRAMRRQKGFYGPFPEAAKQPTTDDSKKGMGLAEKEKMLKVSWLSSGGGGSDYSAVKLKDIFQQFGRVEDVVIRPKTASKRNSALVVMSSRGELVAATKSRCGDVSNPLLVVPLVVDSVVQTEASVENIVGAGYHDYEDAVLKKMRKKAEQLKSSK